MTVSIEIIGIPQLKKFLKKKTKQIDSGVDTGITKATIHVQGEVKQSIAGRRAEIRSVDTGRFLNSVDFNVSKDQAIVFSLVPYAGILEFGARGRAGRKHFNNTKDREQGKIREIIEKEIDKKL